MDEADAKMVLSALRATVASSQGGVELQTLKSDYRELEGEDIPYRGLGFQSLEAYIQSLSKDFSVLSKQGSLFVVAKKSEALAHIQDMVSGQREKKKPFRKTKSFRGKFSGYHTSFNNRNPPKPSSFHGSSSYNKRNGYNKSTRVTSSQPSSSHNDFRTHERSVLARKPSPIRKKSPSRERHEPSTSKAKQSNSRAKVPANLPANIQKMPDHLQKTPESQTRTVEAAYKPADLPNSVSSIMHKLVQYGQVHVDDDTTSVPHDQLLNLHITLPNDQFKAVAPPNIYPRMVPPPMVLPVFTQPQPVIPQMFPPAFRSPVPLAPISPSYSIQNGGCSSSKSSSPEVYIELPSGSTPEDQLHHLAKYLFNEEPEIAIKERKPDPKRPIYTYYAYIQVGSQPRISTLPEEYKSREEARKQVVALALNHFNKLKDERMAKTLKKTTNKLNILIDRIYSLVRQSSNGLVASKIEELYEAKYGEILPDGWTYNPEVCSHPRLEVNSNPISTIVYAKHVSMTQLKASAPLPPLQLPEDNEWPVFVSLMTSVSNIFVRLANDSSEAFFKMCEDLDAFMSGVERPDAISAVEVGELYCLNDDGCWHRVKVETVGEQILVKFIDHGEESLRSLHELYPLYDSFRTIPAQAIELFLPECQAFAEFFDHSEVEADIVGKPLFAVIESRDSLSATLYNTSVEPNVNINHMLFEHICDLFNVSSLPEEKMFKECVYVSYISSEESCIYVQVESIMFQYLTDSIAQLMTSPEVREHLVQSPAEVAEYSEDIFLAKYEGDSSEYYRASVLDVDPLSGNATVRFIDYGDTSVVSCTNLIRLFDTNKRHLCLIPHQAKKVKLVGLEMFSPEVFAKLTTLVNGTEPVILKMTAGRAQLHKRDQDGKIVNINAQVLGSSYSPTVSKSPPETASTKEYDTSPLQPPVIPPVNHMIDVLVETVVSPSNFWIRPQEIYNQWTELVDEMDDYYSEQDETLKPSRDHIRPGASFAYYYEEVELWQRISVNSLISPECVALFLVDYGKIITANTNDLRYLAPQFRKMPAIAINSKLHAIKPTFGDWTPQDNLRFKHICEGEPIKVFKCRIENCTPNLIKGSEPLSVRLLDTHDANKDVDLSSLLVREGRAKMLE